MIPQLVWREEWQAQCVNVARSCVNWEVCRAMCNGLGSVIGHREIRANRPELFHMDGVHLSGGGLEIVLAGLRGGLLLKLERLNGRHSLPLCRGG